MNRQVTENGKLFRFVLNRSRATAPNVYLMLYPKPTLLRALDDRPGLLREVWSALSGMAPETLLGEGRVYGGGKYTRSNPENWVTLLRTPYSPPCQNPLPRFWDNRIPTLFAIE